MDDRDKYQRWLEEMWSVHKFDSHGCAEREERETMLEPCARVTNEALEDLTPEECHRLYKLLCLNVYSRPDEPLETKGVFAGIEAEVETLVCRPVNSRRLAFETTNPVFGFRTPLTDDKAAVTLLQA